MEQATIPLGSNSRRHVDRVVVPRRRGHLDRVRFGSGIDFGSDGFSLVEFRDDAGHPIKILAWFKGFMTPAAGVSGFGYIYVPAHLRLLWSNGFDGHDLASGGRLSMSLLLHHAKKID